MSSYALVGALLVAATPALTAALKQFVYDNPKFSAVTPYIYAIMAWVITSLVDNGVSPTSPEGLQILLTYTTGSLTGAKARDMWKQFQPSV